MSKKSTLSIMAEIVGIIGVLVGIIFGINQWKSSSTDNLQDLDSELSTDQTVNKRIENFVESYFDMLMRRDFSELSNYFNFPVDRFYDLTNASSREIEKQLKAYYSKWRYQRINLDKQSLKVINKENGQKRVQFLLDYQTKKNISDKYKSFKLEIVMLLDSNGKLISIYEMKK